MDIVDVAPGLHLLPLGISNAYLWHDDSGATLIDTGPPGSGPVIKSALSGLGLPREELRRIVLTHFHDDHAGSAEDLAQWSGARVVVGRADAAFVRGDEPGPPLAFTPAEQQLHAVVAAGLQPAPTCRVDQEVNDQDVLHLGWYSVPSTQTASWAGARCNASQRWKPTVFSAAAPRSAQEVMPWKISAQTTAAAEAARSSASASQRMTTIPDRSPPIGLGTGVRSAGGSGPFALS